MKQVFSLKQKLAETPQYNSYLENNAYAHHNIHGLYNTPEWWHNIENGTTPIGTISGTIVGERFLDRGDTNPVFDMELADGSVSWTNYYIHSDDDLKYYVVGKKIEMNYVSENLIKPIKTVKTKAPNSQRTISDIKIVLEVWIEE